MTTPTPLPLRLHLGAPIRSRVTTASGYIAETPYVDHEGITWVPVRWVHPGTNATTEVQHCPAGNLEMDWSSVIPGVTR